MERLPSVNRAQMIHVASIDVGYAIWLPRDQHSEVSRDEWSERVPQRICNRYELIGSVVRKSVITWNHLNPWSESFSPRLKVATPEWSVRLHAYHILAGPLIW